MSLVDLALLPIRVGLGVAHTVLHRVVDLHDGGVMVDASNAQLLPAPLVVAYEPHRASGPLNPPRWTTTRRCADSSAGGSQRNPPQLAAASLMAETRDLNC